MATKRRTALGSLPGGAVNSQAAPRAGTRLRAATGQENAPVEPPPTKRESKKRKSAEDDSPILPPEFWSLDLSKLDPKTPVLTINKDCDQVRRLITRFLDSGEMTKTAFAREIGVSLKSLSSFLGMSGPMSGEGCVAYGTAWNFFLRRELRGDKMPAKKRKTSAAGGGSASSGRKSASKEVDVSDIELDGEDDDAVPVYDTCDEVRRKINAYLKRPGVTQASLCRAIYAQLKGPDRPDRPFQGAQLSRFRNMKGARTGAKLSLFYGAHVFFEKLRIKEGKPKTKHRVEMEAEWYPEGLPRDFDGRDRVVCHVNSRPYIDQYGVFQSF